MVPSSSRPVGIYEALLKCETYEGAGVNGRKKINFFTLFFLKNDNFFSIFLICLLFLENGGNLLIFFAVFGKTVDNFFIFFCFFFEKIEEYFFLPFTPAPS